MTLDTPLTDDELDELDAALATPPLDECSMTLCELEGYFAAMAIGPQVVMPSDWLPWVWDAVEGQAAPDFPDLEAANRVLGLVMRFYNEVIGRLADETEDFRPLYLEFEGLSPEEWCDGFMLGTSFDPDTWDALIDQQPEWFLPILRLSSDEADEPADNEASDDQPSAGEPSDGEREADALAVGPTVTRIRRHFLDQRAAAPQPSPLLDLSPRQPVVRDAPRVGRNDPCPCGSGKKYKKCCGEN